MSHAKGVRRPIRARDTRMAAGVAAWLSRAGVRPNAISLSSAIFSAAAGLCLALTGRLPGGLQPVLFLGAAALIQVRLLCNLLDGMVAIEGGFRTKSGEIFNEFPDRFADTFIFAGAGYAAMNWEWRVPAGWICALLAVLTAYVRSLGVAAGSAQYFCGPMAKQHRMAAMTFACIASAFLSWFGMQWPVIGVSLIFVGAGSLITVFRRARLIVRELESK